MAFIEQSACRNHLLTALPPDAFLQLAPLLSHVALTLRKTLHLPGESIDTVYFPETGYVSLLTPLEDGDAAEVGLIGPEGLVGLPLVFGADRSIVEAMVQAEGTALCMEAIVLRQALTDIPALQPLLLRYALAFNTQVTMTAACNGRHVVEQRLARWLLMAHDRCIGDDFTMTHEFLSMMLGVRRAGVTVAAGMLQKAGLIRYGAGRMTIVDRPGLEAAACECHGIARREAARLLASG